MTKETVTVEIKEVFWDSNNLELIIYYEDNDALERFIERFGKKENPKFMKSISYHLKNPNQMFDILIKVRKMLINQGKKPAELYKKCQTYDSWFRSLVGLTVSLNSYGYLA